MFRLLLLGFSLGALSLLPAVNVETTPLGPLTAAQPVAAGDGQGNVLLVGQQQCSIFQECSPITLVKLDSTGRLTLRRGIGNPLWRWTVTRAALDRAGRIVLAGLTGDSTLPRVKAFRSRPEGVNDIYVMQLSPDGADVLFASYLGGSGPEQLLALAADAEGNIVVGLQTSSADFRFTVGEAPIGGPPYYALARILPATGGLAHTFGLSSAGGPPTFSMTPDGTVVTTALDPPAGRRLITIGPEGVVRPVPINLASSALLMKAVQAPDGSFWTLGITPAASLTPTPGAIRPDPSGFNYQRWEAGQATTPPGPMRQVSVRLLAVDRNDPNRIYANTDKGLYRTEDNGWTWVRLASAPFVSALALAHGDGRLWVLGAEGAPAPALYFSDDHGTTWSRHMLPLSNLQSPLLMAAHPGDRRVVHVASGGTLATSVNAAETWTLRTFPVQVSALAVDSRAVALVGISPESGGMPAIFWSDDGAASFPRTVMASVFPNYQIAFDPSSPGTLYVGLGPRLARTRPEIFPRLEELGSAGPPITTFAFQPGAAGVLYALGVDGNTLRSRDGGATWGSPLAGTPRPPAAPVQMVAGAGGVLHFVTAILPELFLNRYAPSGELLYSTYLGVTYSPPALELVVLPGGQIAVAGQLSTSSGFWGERYGPGSRTTVTPDLFVIAFWPDASLAYAAALAGSGPETMFWCGSGRDNMFQIVGITQSADFPGLSGIGEGISDQASLFFSRLTL